MSDRISDEYEAVDLGNLRRDRRLAKLAEALAKSPTASITAACGGWSETIAAFRLLNSKKVSPEALMAPHRSKTTERCAGQTCVVVSQDTTEVDFTHMKGTQGLGPLNDESRRGFFMHSLYAVSEHGLPLGLIDAAILLRDDETFRSAGERKRLPIEDKESFRWLRGYLQTSALARQIPECEVISISDREGDIFEVYQAWREAGDQPHAGWIIRANQDRALSGVVEGEPSKLFAALEAAPVLGEIEFDVRAGKSLRKIKRNKVMISRSARTVRQVVRAMKITPRPPARMGRKLKEVSFWAVLAEEVDPPEGEAPIRWLLLTSKEVTTLEQAKRILKLYMRRWDIEVFHRVLKTGCRVESIQLANADALVKSLMIYSVISWRILYLTHLGRQCPELPCGCVFEEAEWKSACAVVKRNEDAGEPSLSEFIGIVGKLGGHLGRKRDGAPGPQSIWQGLMRVRDIAMAWHAFRAK